MQAIPNLFSHLLLPWPHEPRVPSMRAAAALEAVLREVGLHGHPHARAILRHMVQVDAAVFPDAVSEDMGTASLIYGLWVYLLDDALDEAGRDADVAWTTARLERAFAALSCDRLPPGADRIDRLAGALRRLLVKDAPAGWMERFEAEVHAYLFEGSLAAARSRAAGAPPDLLTYLDARVHDGAILPAARLLERQLGLAPGPNFERRTAEMRRLAARHVALANDLFSYEKERSRGSTWNLLVVLQEGGRSLSQATAAVAAQLNEDARRFQEICWTRACEDEGDPAEAEFAQGLGRFMTGNLIFSLASERYRSRTSPFAELRQPPAERTYALAS